ncbi:MAG: hypothetical protein LBT10_04795 [Methanobrevibacter sp.]|jgi:hypothetical protein|nr:hypothetical protein [Methanobrevibacter sp.]
MDYGLTSKTVILAIGITELNTIIVIDEIYIHNDNYPQTDSQTAQIIKEYINNGYISQYHGTIRGIITPHDAAALRSELRGTIH